MNIKEIVKKLFVLSLKIWESYNKLKELHFNGNKNTEEYDNYLNIIKELKEEEQKLYDEINDRELILQILLYLSDKDKINNLEADLNALICNNADIIKRRVIINLSNKKQKIDKKNLIRMAKEVDKELKNVKDNTIENSYYKIINLLSLSEATKKDFVNSILILINKDKSLDKNVILDLLYNCSFLFGFCEEDLLKSNFEIDEEIYWLSGMVVDINKMDNEEVEDTKKLFGIEIIKTFKNLDDNEFVKIILRVALLFCSEQELEELERNDKFMHLIKLNNLDKELVRSIRLTSGE